MALSNKKFLDEAGLVKLIGLIKRGISQATATTVQTVGIASEEDTSHYANINIVPNHPRTGNYVTTDGSPKQFTYYDTHYDVAKPNVNDNGVLVQGLDGLMSRADKTKLDGIAAGATRTIVDSAMSTTSTNPVQNKVVDSAIKAAAKTVRQTSQTGSTALPLLVSAQSSPTSGNNYEAGYDADLKFTPNSNTLIVKAATSSASGVTITPTSIKVGTTAAGGAVEMTPTQVNVGTGTLTSTAYSGKATQTETDLANSATGKGASMVAYDATHTVADKIATLDTAIGALKTIEFKIVTSLPTVANGETNVIYLIAHTHTTADSNTAPGTSNAYDEYIKVNKGTTENPTWAWEKIGSTDIDLSNYWNGTNLTALSESDVESLWTSTNAAASAA